MTIRLPDCHTGNFDIRQSWKHDIMTQNHCVANEKRVEIGDDQVVHSFDTAFILDARDALHPRHRVQRLLGGKLSHLGPSLTADPKVMAEARHDFVAGDTELLDQRGFANCCE